MAKTREIKRRIKAVGNIKRITKTMQLIATARFQAALRRATAAKPYTQKIAELVGELAAAAAGASAGGGLAHPLLKPPEPKTNRELLLVITANRGLCGGYNANILRIATQQLRESTGKQIDLEVVGKKGVGYFKYANQAVARVHNQFGDKPSYADVEALAGEYMKLFQEGKYDAVKVVYMEFMSVARQKPVAVTLLPMQPPTDAKASGTSAAKSGAGVQYDFSPEPEKLLATLLPLTVKSRLFQTFNEAIVGEQVARMIAMKSATDAAGKMGKALTRKFNRARQAAITTELTEIISGSAALE